MPTLFGSSSPKSLTKRRSSEPSKTSAPAATIDNRYIEDHKQGVGATLLKGKHPELADRVNFGKICIKHPPESKLFYARLLTIAFKELSLQWEHYANNTTSTEIRKAGTTVSLTLLGEEGTLTTATLGDSMAYIAFFDKESGEAIGVKRLNWRYHTPTSESAQVMLRGGCIHKDHRMDGRLAVSRSIGDVTIKGVSHLPSIDVHSIADIAENLDVDLNNCKVKLINCTDGFLKSMGPIEKHAFLHKTRPGDISGDEQSLMHHLESIPGPGKMLNMQLSEALCKQIRSKLTFDDVTISIKSIDENSLHEYQAVLDGHGGPAAAEFVATRLTSKLSHLLDLPVSKLLKRNNLFVSQEAYEIYDHRRRKERDLTDSEREILLSCKNSVFTKVSALNEAVSDLDKHRKLVKNPLVHQAILELNACLHNMLREFTSDIQLAPTVESLALATNRFQLQLTHNFKNFTLFKNNQRHNVFSLLCNTSEAQVAQIVNTILQCLLSLGAGLVIGLVNYSQNHQFNTRIPLRLFPESQFATCRLTDNLSSKINDLGSRFGMRSS